MAAGDILIVEGTPIVFGSEAGDDVNWSTEGIVDGAGRESNQYYVGPSPRTNKFNVRFYTEFQATPTLQTGVDVYIKRSDGTVADNNTGTVDAAVAVEAKLINCWRLGAASVDEAAANVQTVLAIEEVLLNAPYIQFVLFNKSGAALSASISATKAILTPITYQGQS